MNPLLRSEKFLFLASFPSFSLPRVLLYFFPWLLLFVNCNLINHRDPCTLTRITNYYVKSKFAISVFQLCEISFVKILQSFHMYFFRWGWQFVSEKLQILLNLICIAVCLQLIYFFASGLWSVTKTFQLAKLLKIKVS